MNGRSITLPHHMDPERYSDRPSRDPIVVGVLEGEGIGQEVVPAAVSVLERVCDLNGLKLELRHGGPIGRRSIATGGKALSPGVKAFCSEVFDGGGAIFSGPGGARFVYDLRAYFDLYCKFTPLVPFPGLASGGLFCAGHTDDVDILAIRENTGGLYYCEEANITTNPEEAGIRAAFGYSTPMVRRILKAGCLTAQRRRHRMALTTKPDGIPLVSELWRSEAERLCTQSGVTLEVLEIDNAVYQLVAAPKRFDVIVSPNMFGDVLADAGSLLLGSRGMSFSGNFGDGNRAVYQTGHGAAYDIAGSGTANPLGQIMAVAMMLRESFGQPHAARSVEQAIATVLNQGIRTADIASGQCAPVGTREMTTHVLNALTRESAPA